MPEKLAFILAIEDGDEDFDMLSGAFATCNIQNPLVRARDATEALQMLTTTGQVTRPSTSAKLHDEIKQDRPCLILLDLNLPDIDGRELLRRIKQIDDVRGIPIMILTTSNSPQDVAYCYAQGASCYTIKPIGICALESLVAAFKNFWLERAVLPS